jgi:hypothetical protein
LKRICGWLLVLAILASCDTKLDLAKIRHFDFEMYIDRSFTENVMADIGGYGELIYLRGEGSDEPRIQIIVEPLILPLGEKLEEMAAIDTKPGLIKSGEFVEYSLSNSEGLGQKIQYQPFPDLIPELEFVLDIRVFLFENKHYTFILRRLPLAEDWQSKYDKWMKTLIFDNARD